LTSRCARSCIRGVDEWTRPRTRGECRDAERPCPFVACKHHLYLDVNPETGSLKLNFPDLEPWELEDSVLRSTSPSAARSRSRRSAASRI
jgi:hypothetical protein